MIIAVLWLALAVLAAANVLLYVCARIRRTPPAPEPPGHPQYAAAHHDERLADTGTMRAVGYDAEQIKQLRRRRGQYGYHDPYDPATGPLPFTPAPPLEPAWKPLTRAWTPVAALPTGTPSVLELPAPGPTDVGTEPDPEPEPGPEPDSTPSGSWLWHEDQGVWEHVEDDTFIRGLTAIPA